MARADDTENGVVTPPIISRTEAKAIGLKRYFTGVPCKKGHISERQVCSWGCMACKSEAARDTRLADIDAARARDRERRVLKAEQIKVWHKTYNDKNKAKISKTSRLWYLANKDVATEARRRYAAQNPEVRRSAIRNRQARLRGAYGSHTAAQIEDLARRQRHKCATCGADIRKYREADHIVPLSKGGRNGIENIQLLCLPCNRRKGAKDPIDWAQENGRLL